MKYKKLLDLLITVSEELFGGDLSILRTRDGWRVIFSPLEVKDHTQALFDSWTPEPTLLEAATKAMRASDEMDAAKPCR